jgi:hypothetical protein
MYEKYGIKKNEYKSKIAFIDDNSDSSYYVFIKNDEQKTMP